MEEEELKRHMFLNRCGVFSVRKNSREILESLNYSVEVLKSGGNLVTIYPEGEIRSIHNQEFVFARGAEWIIKKLGEKVAVYFAVVLIDYFSNAKPIITTYLYNYKEGCTTGELQLHYNRFYQDCVKRQIPC